MGNKDDCYVWSFMMKIVENIEWWRVWMLKDLDVALRKKNIFDCLWLWNLLGEFNCWYLEGDKRLTTG